jgi:hypothetical protein
MKHIHVECLPDETLVRQLGFSNKYITHHSGKSRVMKKLGDVKNEIAMVDEDPGTAKTTFEKNLKSVGDEEGIIQYLDNAGNKIIVLQGKLEDWILAVCKRNKININDFGLPDKPNELHSVIHHKLPNFEKLIIHLLKTNNKALHTLKNCLK